MPGGRCLLYPLRLVRNVRRLRKRKGARSFVKDRVKGSEVIENAYYSPEVQGPYELFDLGNFTLEEGPTLRGCQLAYATFGELNDARDNAVLVTPWYSGTHQIFADAYIGSEHALDPEKYFIVVAQTRSATASPPRPTTRKGRSPGAASRT